MSLKIRKKMERYRNGVLYSITINPCDELQFVGKADRFFKLQNWLKEHGTDLVKGVDHICVYPDVSFPQQLQRGKYPRIHYHGSIRFKDINRFLLSSGYEWSTHFQVEIDTIEDEGFWFGYCEKYHHYVNKEAPRLFRKDFMPSEVLPPAEVRTIYKMFDDCKL